MERLKWADNSYTERNCIHGAYSVNDAPVPTFHPHCKAINSHRIKCGQPSNSRDYIVRDHVRVRDVKRNELLGHEVTRCRQRHEQPRSTSNLFSVSCEVNGVHMSASSQKIHEQHSDSCDLCRVHHVEVVDMHRREDVKNRRKHKQLHGGSVLIHVRDVVNVYMDSKKRHADSSNMLIAPAKWKRKRLPNENELKQELTRIWAHFIKQLYPNLHTQPYFKPPMLFNRVRYDEQQIGQTTVKILTPIRQLSDLREDESLQRVHHVLCRLFARLQEPMMVLFQLDFDNYLNKAGMSTKGEAKQKVPNAPNGHGMSEGMAKQNGTGTSERMAKQNGTGTSERMAKQNGLGMSERMVKQIGLGMSERMVKQIGLGMSERTMKAGEAALNDYNSGVCVNDELLTESRAAHGSLNHGGAPKEPDMSVFSRPRDLDTAYRRGTFDILIIHPQHGVIILEVKAVGDAFSLSEELQQSVAAQYEVIRKKVERSLKQLEKEEKVLRYLLQDLGAASVPVAKGLILPNLPKQTVLAALMHDSRATEHVCRCLKGETLEDSLQKCIFADQLPPLGNSYAISDDMVEALQSHWWSRLVGGAASSGLSQDLYESLIARFCGPATTQFVPTAHNPRAEVSTLSQAVLETSRCFSAPVLTSSQAEVVRGDLPRVFLTGPPGTGKTLMLTLKAQDWVKQKKTVLVLSLWEGSEAVSCLIHRKVAQESCPSVERLRLLRCTSAHLDDIVIKLKNLILSLETIDADGAGMNETVRNSIRRADQPPTTQDSRSSETVTPMGRDVSTRPGCYQFPPAHDSTRLSLGGPTEPSTSRGRQDKVHVILAEAPWFLDVFVKRLEAELGKDGVVIWAASSFPSWRPKSFKEVVLTQSLRCPPVVVREMMKSRAYATFVRHDFTSLDTGVLSGMPSPTDGPPVKGIRHEGHGNQGGDRNIWDCQDCGAALASFLTRDLRIKARDADTTDQQNTLHFSDVVISGYVPPLAEDDATTSDDDKMEWTGEDYFKVRHSPTTSRRGTPGFLRGLQKGSDVYISFEIIRKGDPSSVEKLAAPERLDRVEVAEPQSLLGLERAVVVVIGTNDLRATYPRHVDPCFDVMGRCTSQLIIVGQVDDGFDIMFREKLALKAAPCDRVDRGTGLHPSPKLLSRLAPSATPRQHRLGRRTKRCEG